VYGMGGMRQDEGGVPVVQHLVVAIIACLLAQQVVPWWWFNHVARACTFACV